MKTTSVVRTNYDRFEFADGTVFTGLDITRLRKAGWTVEVVDATPADCGSWVLAPL